MAIDPETRRANHAAHANFGALYEGDETTMSTSFGRFVGTSALVFAFVFTALAATQYWFVGWRLHETTRDELWDKAESLDEDIAFRKGWDLAGYRRSTTAPNTPRIAEIARRCGFIRLWSGTGERSASSPTHLDVVTASSRRAFKTQGRRVSGSSPQYHRRHKAQY